MCAWTLKQREWHVWRKIIGGSQGLDSLSFWGTHPTRPLTNWPPSLQRALQKMSFTIHLKKSWTQSYFWLSSLKIHVQNHLYTYFESSRDLYLIDHPVIQNTAKESGHRQHSTVWQRIVLTNWRVSLVEVILKCAQSQPNSNAKTFISSRSQSRKEFSE